jgi:hypothetical protein
MKAKFLGACTLLTLLAVRASIAGASETTVPAPVDPFLACVRILSIDAQFEGLSKKLPIYDMKTISFAMLADSSIPTPQERKNLLAWFDRRDKCWTDSEPLHRAQWPAEIFQLSQEGNAAIHNIGLDLYHRKITFGEANRQIQDRGNEISGKVVPIVKRYQEEIAAQKAAQAQIAARKQEAAEQRAAQQQANYQAQEQFVAARQQADQMQRRQLFMGYLGAMQQQQMQLRQQQAQQLQQQFAPKPTYQTNCSTVGSSTDCITH